MTIHYWNFYALLVVIVMHITGVVVTELREGGGVVSAMFTGRKVSIGNPGRYRGTHVTRSELRTGACVGMELEVGSSSVALLVFGVWTG